MAKVSRFAIVGVILTLPASPVLAQEATDPAPTAVASVAPAPYTQQFGLAMRGRYVTVPSWFLGLFTKEATPLHTSGFVIEGFRRKDNFDIAVGLGYQNMSPPHGNWLGRGKEAAIDTDYVQVKGMSLISLDVNFVWNAWVNEYLGFYYGAGLGLGILTGKVLRTSAAGCNADNVGDETQCKPIVCAGATCSEDELARSEGGKDNGPGDPHRFKESSIPGAIPIINVVGGVSLRFPEVRGLELRLLEAGFHNAFFLGSSVAYLF